MNKPPLKFLILGAGGIGGYFGARLLQTGNEVSFLVRPARKALMDAQGLRLSSVKGDWQGAVETFTQVPPGRAFDVVVITCKSYDLEGAIEAIRPAVGGNTVVLPLLNGLSHLERLNQVFGADRVLGGLAKIVVMLDLDGSIKHLNDWSYITFGEQGGGLSERVKAIEAAFPADSVIAKAVPDIRQAMWEKLVHLSTVATMTCLMRASVGELARVPGGTQALISVLETNAEIAAREGCRPPESFLADFRKLFADTTVSYVPSILRDIDRHNPIEGEHIVGFMVAKAHQHGVPAPLHEIALMHLRAYEERRKAGRL